MVVMVVGTYVHMYGGWCMGGHMVLVVGTYGGWWWVRMYVHIRVSFRKMGKGGQNNTYKINGGGQRECTR